MGDCAILCGREETINKRIVSRATAGLHRLELDPFDRSNAFIARSPIVAAFEHRNVMNNARLFECAIELFHLRIIEVFVADGSVIDGKDEDGSIPTASPAPQPITPAT